MSKNALALVDCSNREKLFHFLINTFDRKSTKKEMVSPYDDQLIGKMNFRYSGMDHAMFFTYAHSSEYPGKKFHNHKIIYLSLEVNDISSDIFNRICSRFGGYVIYNDDLETDWEKIEQQQFDGDDDLSLSEEIVAERRFLFDTEEEGEKRKVYQELKIESEAEEVVIEQEWTAFAVEEKHDRKSEVQKQDKKLEYNRNGKNYRGDHQKERMETQVLTGQCEDKSDIPKITVRETLRSHERTKEQRENRKNVQKQKSVLENDGKNITKENNKDEQKLNTNHRRGHRGGKKHYGKSQQSKHSELDTNTQNEKTNA